MKKKWILLGTAILALTAGFAGCGESHTYTLHKAVEAGCEKAGNEAYYTCEDCDAIFDENKQEIFSVPVIAPKGHAYELQEAVEGTCCTLGWDAYYTCAGCDGAFDLQKNAVEDVAHGYEVGNHEQPASLTIVSAPTKTEYRVGETFDAAGFAVSYGCAACDGFLVDPQFLTYEYSTGGGAFVNGDTALTVSFRGVSTSVAITAKKATVELLGVQDSYQTVCGLAPEYAVTSNLVDSEINVQYFDGALEIMPSELLAGKTYTMQFSVAETETAEGAQATANVAVAHQNRWMQDATNAQKRLYACGCGVEKFHVLDEQIVWVDDVDMRIDLSKYVVGASAVSVKSVQQLLMANGDQAVDISGVNTDMVYTFDKELYERLSEQWTPYFLKLSVKYDVDGVEAIVTVTSKYVERVIRKASDLNELVYTGASSSGDSGSYAMTGMYVLANDIDASGVKITTSNPCWQAAIGFLGVFEGNGHTISNLTINAYSQGLFGAIGYGAKIQNVTFENVMLGKSSYLLAFCVRNAAMSNVTVKFNESSTSFGVAYSVNDSELSNISVLTKSGQTPFVIDESSSNPLPGGVKVESFATTKTLYALPAKKED